MGLFGKKKDENENDLQASELEDQLPVKKTLPTQPRRSRKPKEPIKPWTKKERLFVFYVLIFTVISSAIFGLSAREWKLPGLPKITFQIPSLTSEKIILENQNKNNDARLTQEFTSLTNNLSGVYGFYVVDLTTNKEYGSDENEIFQAASLIKLPVIIAAYQQAEAGNFNLDAKYSLKDTDKIGGSGSLQYKPAGTILTFRQLINLMGKHSDNTAYGIIKEEIGEKKINEVILDMGLTKTNIDTNETSPKEIGKMFFKLHNGDLVKEDHKNEILVSLTDTIYEEHLPKGVSENIKVAHKYGREVHVVNDGGVVFSPKPYIVVIMSKGVVESEADEIFPGLSAAIYNYINQ